MKKKILILGGGLSKERQISFNTAKQVKNILKKKYKVFQCDFDKNFIDKVKKFRPNIIFNAYMVDLEKMDMSNQYWSL